MTISNIEIEYEKMVANYWKNLNTMLRGFNPSEEYTFLETWVPDDDIIRSILDILDAANDAEIDKISIHISEDTLHKIEYEKLLELSKKFGKMSESKDKEGRKIKIIFRETDSLLEIHPVYRENIKKAMSTFPHDCLIELKSPEDSILIQSNYDNITLTAVIDRSNHSIKEVSYQGAISDAQRGVLEVLCKIIEGMPIQECSDHSVIELEFELRDYSQPRPVFGITMPNNADPIFKLPINLTKNLLENYRKMTGYTDTRNAYDRSSSIGGSSTSNIELINQIQSMINSHNDGKGVTVLSINGEKQVVIKFEEILDSMTKHDRIVRLENHLKRLVEPTLQLYMEPKIDQNLNRELIKDK